MTCLLAVGCGKKGPPLAPLVRLPAAVQDMEVTRLGRDAYVTFEIPKANLDRSTPVDLAFVDVYAYTGTVAPRAGFVEMATRIARVPVALPASSSASPTLLPAAAAVGSTVTIVDTLPIDGDADARRFYLAVPMNTRDRPGQQHVPVEVRLTPVPDPPLPGSVTYTATTISLTWVMEAETSPSVPPQVARMNVYREPADGRSSAIPWQEARPRPLNGSPLAVAPFTEPVAFGVDACYVLRRVVGEGAAAVEGDASPPVCVTPIDTFAPAAPTQLVAVATGAGISLLWEASADPDTAGYVVLRGAVGEETLRPLTPAPVDDVRYLDRTAVAGMRYVYAVVAVDGRMPTPNVSPESARVEETAQ